MIYNILADDIKMKLHLPDDMFDLHEIDRHNDKINIGKALLTTSRAILSEAVPVYTSALRAWIEVAKEQINEHNKTLEKTMAAGVDGWIEHEETLFVVEVIEDRIWVTEEWIAGCERFEKQVRERSTGGST